MSSYKFIKGFPIEGLRENFETNLFHRINHLLLQSKDGWCSYAIVDSSKTILEAIIHFHIHEGIALSPLRAPFGSLVFSKELPFEILRDFLDFVQADFHDSGVKKVIIKNYPDAYFPRQSEILKYSLLEHGYEINHTDQTSVISVTEKTFESILHKSPLYQLKKCRGEDLKVKRISTTGISRVYSFLEECHKEKGYKLSMTFPEVENTVKVFPNDFFLFGVFFGEELVAANISIRIKSNVLYHFYQNHLKALDSLSPVILLSEHIYQFCQQEGIEVLDLGTSSLTKRINQSLLDFKLRLGAVTSAKVTFAKTLTHG